MWQEPRVHCLVLKRTAAAEISHPVTHTNTHTHTLTPSLSVSVSVSQPSKVGRGENEVN